MAIKRKLRNYFSALMKYFMLIGIIIGIRALYGMELRPVFYGVMTGVVSLLLLGFSFLEPQHLEKVLPKDSTAALLVTLSLRFLPLMRRKVGNIKHTQEMRGAKFTGLSQIKNYLSLFIPAIVVSMNWANELSDGIRMRGAE